MRADGLLASNLLCLLGRAGLRHEFALSVDLDRQKLRSLSFFPLGLYDQGAGECGADEQLPQGAKLSGKVVVATVEQLPA